MTVLLDRPIRGHPVDTAPARADAVARAVAAAAVAASLAVVVTLWAGGGGITALAGWADGLTSLGRLTGLLAADLLLVQVLLMARIPVVERAVGQDRLARWHRLAGSRPSRLMLAHIGFITWGDAAGRLSRSARDVLGAHRRRPRHAARRWRARRAW